ncbi:MAG: DHH family phosphoesterase [Lachnospiraceae bacterium]|nr:DHH family phosphoesterase [Lachnospiraceae bacterium]
MAEHTLTELIGMLKSKQDSGAQVYVQTHNFPDPDAIASAFGMQKLLAHYDIRAGICYHGKIDRVNTRKMLELIGIEMSSKDELDGIMKETDPIICVDSQKEGGNILDLIGDEVACVDHHPTVQEIEYFYKDVRIVGSCATLITEYFRTLEVPMDRPTATALLYGLKMDTMGFSRGVKEQDIDAFAFLYRLADNDLLSRLEHNQMMFHDLGAYGAAISETEVYGKVGFSRIPFACPEALIAIASDFLLSLDEVDVAIIYAIREDGFKYSIRSEVRDVDAGRLVGRALDGVGNGGGHAFMAGGFVPSERLAELGPDPDGVLRDRFLQVLKEEFHYEV